VVSKYLLSIASSTPSLVDRANPEENAILARVVSTFPLHECQHICGEVIEGSLRRCFRISFNLSPQCDNVSLNTAGIPGGVLSVL
jgi:hypothetical protein